MRETGRPRPEPRDASAPAEKAASVSSVVGIEGAEATFSFRDDEDDDEDGDEACIEAALVAAPW